MGQELLELERCVVGIEGESDLVALRLKEELGTEPRFWYFTD